MSYHVNLMFSKENWGTGRKSNFPRQLLFSNWATVWLQEDMSDCLCIICPCLLLLSPNKWALSWPTSSLAYHSSCSLLQPTWASSCLSVWLLALVNPPQCPISAGSLWPQHNPHICFLCSDEILQQTLAKTRESLIFLLSVSITVNQWAN